MIQVKVFADNEELTTADLGDLSEADLQRVQQQCETLALRCQEHLEVFDLVFVSSPR